MDLLVTLHQPQAKNGGGYVNQRGLAQASRQPVPFLIRDRAYQTDSFPQLASELISDAIDRPHATPADIRMRDAAGIRDMVEVLDEQDGLVARDYDNMRILISQKPGQIVDLRLCLPRAGRRAVDDERVDAICFTQPPNRRQATLVFGS